MNTKIMTDQNENIFFDYIDASGVVKKAKILTVFTIDGSDKQYAACSIPTDDGNFDITAYIVNDLGNDTISLDDIESDEEFDRVSEVIKDLME